MNRVLSKTFKKEMGKDSFYILNTTWKELMRREKRSISKTCSDISVYFKFGFLSTYALSKKRCLLVEAPENAAGG